jgi:hypothetical protein
MKREPRTLADAAFALFDRLEAVRVLKASRERCECAEDAERDTGYPGTPVCFRVMVRTKNFPLEEALPFDDWCEPCQRNHQQIFLPVGELRKDLPKLRAAVRRAYLRAKNGGTR